MQKPPSLNDTWALLDADDIDDLVPNANPDFELAPIEAANDASVFDSSDPYRQTELKLILDSVLLSLPEEEEQVLKMYFGVPDGNTHTIAKIADAIGITKAQATQTKVKALRKLKHPSLNRRLRTFLADQDAPVASTAQNNLSSPARQHRAHEASMAEKFKQHEAPAATAAPKTPEEEKARKHAKLSSHVKMGAAWMKAGELIEKGKRIAVGINGNPLTSPDTDARAEMSDRDIADPFARFLG